MNITPSLVAIIACASLEVAAQGLKRAEPVILERGLNHRVVQNESGGTYTVLADGLCYEENGVLKDSQDLIELAHDGNGAIAGKGRHKASFPPNITAPVTVTLPDGSRFVARPFCIAYFDSLSGNSVLIAELASAVGELHPPNQVVYPRAFPEAGADVRYTYRRGSFAQDIIIRSRLPDVALWNFDPAFIRVECWSEILESPAIAKTIEVLSAEQDPNVRALMAAPDVIDETLTLGGMQIGRGKAFPINDADSSIPVSKELLTIEGRRFLIETIEYSAAEPILRTLPAADQANLDRWKQRKPRARHELIAAVQPKQPDQWAEARVMQVAKNIPSGPALVADYDMHYNQSYGNFTFAAGKTYLLNGILTLSGTTTLESAVIKYPPNSPYFPAYIKISGTGSKINCITAPYRPAIFTASTDNTVGETVTAGTPSGYYATYAIYFDSSADGNSFLHDIRIRYANSGIYYSSGSGHKLRHSQIVSCYKAVEGAINSSARLQNCLLSAYDPINGYYFQARGENLTITGGSIGSSAYIALTNTLIGVYTPPPPPLGGVANYNVPSGTFQTVGTGNFYLANETYRDAGTTAIDPELLADLAKRTTHAPVVLTANFTGPTVLSPEVPRDLGPPSCGYHYDPIDFAWQNLELSSTLVLTGGVTVAHYGVNGTVLKGGATFISEGLPTARNHLVQYTAVQDNLAVWGSGSGNMSFLSMSGQQPSPAPQVSLRFTDIDFVADVAADRKVMNFSTYTATSIALTDCELTAAYLNIPFYGALIVGLTNNLFRRADIALQRVSATPVDAYLFNNTFINSTVALTHDSGVGTWEVRDNFFDAVALSSGSAIIPNSHNGYIGTAVLPGSQGSDKFPTLRDYQTVSPGLGTNYYPTTGSGLNTLRNAGSRLASGAGLFHHTVKTDQTRAGIPPPDPAMVSIGYHYVALSGNGRPYDADFDALVDCLEDRNGNGLFEVGETYMTNPDHDGDGLSDGNDVNPLNPNGVFGLGSLSINRCPFH